MSTHLLRVVWPILDDAMYDDEAVAEAWFQWASFPEQHQVTVVDTPRMRVIQLNADQQRELQATRAVVCEAPVIRRTKTTPKERRAA